VGLHKKKGATWLLTVAGEGFQVEEGEPKGTRKKALTFQLARNVNPGKYQKKKRDENENAKHGTPFRKSFTKS